MSGFGTDGKEIKSMGKDKAYRKKQVRERKEKKNLFPAKTAIERDWERQFHMAKGQEWTPKFRENRARHRHEDSDNE